MKQKIILLSGGFDPIHIGHIRMIQAAAKYGSITIAVNTDEWLLRKKGFIFMCLPERMEIIESIKAVDNVVVACDLDDSVCATLHTMKPDIFGNGGDRVADNVPEVALCNSLGIELVWNLGQGGKIQSSSDLTRSASESKKD